jgi:NADH-quinone oxidoreductase subunit A
MTFPEDEEERPPMTVLVGYLVVFLGIAVFFLFFHLMLGRLVRPAKPDPDKLTIYECGEPTVGSAWIQFDLRYYVVALLFVIFDVEVAFFFPWAVVFGKANTLADPSLDSATRAAVSRELVPTTLPTAQAPGRPEVHYVDAETAHALAWVGFLDIVVFFGVLLVGFAYLWKRGDINWVRSTAAELPAPAEARTAPERAEPAEAGALVGAGRAS